MFSPNPAGLRNKQYFEYLERRDMARITVEDCLNQIDNRFEMVLTATKRARQIGVPIIGDGGIQFTLPELSAASSTPRYERCGASRALPSSTSKPMPAVSPPAPPSSGPPFTSQGELPAV